MTTKPKTDPIAAIKAKLAELDLECVNLGVQVTRSQEFLRQLETKIIRAQGAYAKLEELLKTLDPTYTPETKANAPKTPVP